MNFSKLGYTIKQINKILRISRNLAWKWYNFDKYKGKWNSQTKILKKKKFLFEQVERKIRGKDGASFRVLQKEFYEKIKKISHTTIKTMLNESLSKPFKVINTFNLTRLHEEKRIKCL